MCIRPNHVWIKRGPNWEQQPVACRQCWRCKQNRVNDYVARSMAEAATSAVVCTVNLTYAPREDLADKLLHPRHFQLFMKLLRRAGHKVRYLVAGEYGETKGRAHFHAILFFEELMPLPEGASVPAYKSPGPFCREIPQKRMIHLREWPHGHVTVDWTATEKAIRYVCKYLLADDKNNAWFSLSKKPPLGAAWFAQKAAMARHLEVLPSTFEYMPPGGTRGRPYMMTGATRRDYLNAITQDAGKRESMSEWVGKTFDKQQRERLMSELLNQPLDVLKAAWEENMDRIFDQKHLLHPMPPPPAEVVSDMLAPTGDTILRRYNGRWMPDSEAKERMARDEQEKEEE